MIQKSVPIFTNTQPPHSAVAKRLLREILREELKPVSFEEMQKLRKQCKARKRVFLREKDTDLIKFFDTTPLTLQYAVFKKLNEKLQEVRP
jgi:PHP family Zn ribbon phosphoesterase